MKQVFLIIFLSLSSFCISQTITPEGYSKEGLPQKMGIEFYRHASGNHFMFVVDLNKGALIKLNVNQIVSQGANDGFFGGNNPTIHRERVRQIFEHQLMAETNIFALINGTFFGNGYLSLIRDNLPISFPLQINGELISGGNEDNPAEFNCLPAAFPCDGGMKILELWQDRADVVNLLADNTITPILEQTSAPNFIVGRFMSNGDVFQNTEVTFRNFIGVSNDGKKIYLLLSSASNIIDGANTLIEFGASSTKLLELDGGGSTNLIGLDIGDNVEGYIEQERDIPQTISICSNSPPNEPILVSFPYETIIGEEVSLTIRRGIDINGDQVKVQLTAEGSNYWGESPYDSGLGIGGTEVTPILQFSSAGTKKIYVICYDEHGAASSREDYSIIVKEPFCSQCDPNISIADGFQYPIGTICKYTEINDGDGWYNARDFTVGNHLGEDWNLETGGNSDCGKPIYAIANGVVESSRKSEFDSDCWDSYAIIRHQLPPHGELVESFYGHLGQVTVSEGEQVERGQLIGYLGANLQCPNASICEGHMCCHLHFEMRNPNSRNWGKVREGYSSNTTGWFDPSDFIDEHLAEDCIKNVPPSNDRNVVATINNTSNTVSFEKGEPVTIAYNIINRNTSSGQSNSSNNEVAVKIDLYKENEFIGEIANNVPSNYGDNTHTWTPQIGLPDLSNIRFKVSLSDNPEIADFTNPFFIYTKPENENCSSAINIPGLQVTCSPNIDDQQIFYLDNATNSDNGLKPSCVPAIDGDIWFKIQVPNSGNLTIKTAATGVNSDIGMTIYSGSCNNLVEIACNDGGGGQYPKMPSISLENRTIGEALYIRLFDYDDSNYGPMYIWACDEPTTNEETCSDGKQNQGETGIDCGGPCAACPIQTGDPNLIVENITVPATIDPTNPFSVQVSIKNTGAFAVPSFKHPTTAIYISRDVTLSGDDVKIREQEITAYEPNASNTHTFDILGLASDSYYGDYYLIAFVDNNEEVEETREDDNYKIEPIFIGIPNRVQPDMTVVSAGINTGNIIPGTSVSIGIQYQNTGDYENFGYEQSINQLYLTDGITRIPFLTFQTVQLNSLSSKTIQLNENIPTDLASGNWSLEIVLDENNAIQESNETNNSYVIPISIDFNLPVADFRASRTNICTGAFTTFYSDYSTGRPTSFLWNFEGGMPTTSTSSSPNITYNTPGIYEVTLEATNANGTNTATKTAYITVSDNGTGTIETTLAANEVETAGGNVFSPTIPSTKPLIIGDRICYPDFSGLKCFPTNPLSSASTVVTGDISDVFPLRDNRYGVSTYDGNLDMYFLNGTRFTRLGQLLPRNRIERGIFMEGINREMIIAFEENGGIRIRYDGIQFIGDINKWTWGGTCKFSNTTRSGGDIYQTPGELVVYMGKGNQMIPMQLNLSPTTNNEIGTVRQACNFIDNLPGDIMRIIGDGDYLYVLMKNGQLGIFDRSNRLSPALIQYINIPDMQSTGALHIQTVPDFGKLLFVGGKRNGSKMIAIYNLDDPTNPELKEFDQSALLSRDVYSIIGQNNTNKIYSQHGSKVLSFELSELQQIVCDDLDASITTSGSLTICEGESITLNAQSGYNYLWSNDKTTQSITVSEAGTYTVKVSICGECSATSEPIIIEKEGGFNLSSIITNDTCDNNIGAINLTPSNGQAPYIYLWSDGITIQNRTNLSAGIYLVTVTDAIGCEQRDTFTVGNIGDTPTAIFQVIENEGTVTIINESIGANEIQIDYGDGTAPSAIPIHTYTQNGSNEICLTATNDCGNQIECKNIIIDFSSDQIIPLKKGWNLISSNIYQDNIPIAEVFSSVMPYLNNVKDNSKNYDPTKSDFLNTLKVVEKGKGYWVNVNQDCILTLSGTPVDRFNTNIPLQTGWNLVGFLGTNPIEIEVALAPILSVVEEVKDESKVYNPSFIELATLRQLESGKGYWIRVNQPTTLTYNY